MLGNTLPPLPSLAQAEVLPVLLAMQQELDKLQGQLQQLIQGVQPPEAPASQTPESTGQAAMLPPVVGPAHEHPSVAQVQSGYDKKWTYIEKIQHVLRQPELYSSSATLKGITGVINAIFQEEPELAASEEAAAMWTKRFGETLSRMTKRNLFAVKMYEVDAASEYHFVSVDWFENGKPKPIYEEATKQLRLLTKLKSPARAAK